MYIPSSLLVYGVGSFWHSRRDSMFVTVMERGLTPPAVGLLFAGALSVLEASDPTIFSIIVTIATTVAIYVFRLGPYIVMGVIAVLYFGIALFGASG
jgi:chromate transporter